MKAPELGRSILAWVFGTALLLGLAFLVHRSVGWGALLVPWGELGFGALATASTLILVSYALRALRVHDFFRPSTQGRFLGTFRLVLIHNLLNNLLPMRSGEASFPILMSREFGVPFARSIPGLLFLRLLDLHFVLLLGLVVLFWNGGWVAWLGPLLLLPLPYLAFKTQEMFRDRIQGSTGKGGKWAQKALEGLPDSPSVFWRTWLWTGVNWTAKLSVLAWILQAFTPMPFAHALVGSTTGELSSVLPFHGIAGAGTYEAGVLASLLPLGVAGEAALRAAVNLHLFVLGISILAGSGAALFPGRRRKPGGSTDDS